MFYVWDGLGPTCRRTRRLRSSVWAILLSAQVDNVPHGDFVFLLALTLSSRLLPTQTLTNGGGGESRSGGGENTHPKRATMRSIDRNE